MELKYRLFMHPQILAGLLAKMGSTTFKSIASSYKMLKLCDSIRKESETFQTLLKQIEDAIIKKDGKCINVEEMDVKFRELWDIKFKIDVSPITCDEAGQLKDVTPNEIPLLVELTDPSFFDQLHP